MSRYLDREGISYTTYADFTDSLAGLAKGEIDFVVADAAVGRYYAQHDGRRTVQVVGETFAPDQIAFAFPKGSSLTEDVNSALEWVKKEGTFEVLKYRYFGE